MFCQHTVLRSEYLLVLQLPAEVSREISTYKSAFKKEYGFSNAVITRPHLTLLKFFQYERYEELIIKKIIQLAETVKAFEVQLDNFGTFTHTIYVAVKTVSPILEIVYNRKGELKPLLSDSKSFFFTKKPHITIARGLLAAQCGIAWNRWRNKSYRANFETSAMTLLRRRSGSLRYDEIGQFYFKGLQSAYMQTELF